MPTTISTATTRSCRWPLADDPDDYLGDPAGFPMCGETTVAPGRPYCGRHLAVARDSG